LPLSAGGKDRRGQLNRAEHLDGLERASRTRRAQSVTHAQASCAREHLVEAGWHPHPSALAVAVAGAGGTHHQGTLAGALAFQFLPSPPPTQPSLPLGHTVLARNTGRFPSRHGVVPRSLDQESLDHLHGLRRKLEEACVQSSSGVSARVRITCI